MINPRVFRKALTCTGDSRTSAGCLLCCGVGIYIQYHPQSGISDNFAIGVSVDHCFEEMSLVLGEGYPHLTTIFRRYQEFNRGNLSLENAPTSGLSILTDF